ncbi:hypothetical protein TIFTF001_051946 [Ficus carica]|uniref:Uncharacterized protein n=1 Tax=Ficus carica TaxID=3494 RepID=A0AA88ED03_FICCA|nr:hypothetical protein TIFTF001_051946 [Ficus carica]
MTGAESISRKSLVQKAIVAEFDDHLNFEVVESSRRSDPIWASKDMIDKLVEAKKAEEHALKTEEARKKAENVLASAQSEHYCYLQEVLPAILDQAQQ